MKKEYSQDETRKFKILHHLREAYQLADNGDNFAANDAGGCKFCWKIKNMIKPIISKLERNINVYKISQFINKRVLDEARRNG